jgi:hypothetical protein
LFLLLFGFALDASCVLQGLSGLLRVAFVCFFTFYAFYHLPLPLAV